MSRNWKEELKERRKLGPPKPIGEPVYVGCTCNENEQKCDQCLLDMTRKCYDCHEFRLQCWKVKFTNNTTLTLCRQCLTRRNIQTNRIY